MELLELVNNKDVYKPMQDALNEQRVMLVKAFIKKLDTDDIDTLMNAISNQFGVEEITDWLKREGVV